MNRIILIGNGFDVSHGLPTRYEDFIKWYWERRLKGFAKKTNAEDKDALCEFIITKEAQIGGKKITTWKEFYEHKNEICPNQTSAIGYFFELKKFLASYRVNSSLFLDNICKAITQKGWVDIENEYYRLLVQCKVDNKSIGCSVQDLNKQLECLQEQLVKYLYGYICYTDINDRTKELIYEPIKVRDVAVSAKESLVEWFQYWLQQDKDAWIRKMQQYELDDDFIEDMIEFRQDLIDCRTLEWNNEPDADIIARYNGYHPKLGLLPDNILLLNFNYTINAEQYFIRMQDCVKFNNIHGRLAKKGSGIIFGYGDELDDKYNQLLSLNDNECLKNIKSAKYLESSNYRDMLSFIESAPYQVYIMGHSCGNSDRTLLNTLFEHRNCVTIKPFYHKKEDGTDNYLDLVQNISRNFTDMKLMRDRVVNKTFCEPLPQSCYLL